MTGKSTKVFGAGINDADYQVSKRIGSKRQRCKFYQAWSGMLKRCYSEEYQAKRPTYKGCYVCSEWLIFSNFKRWMEAQDWQGKELDKDLIKRGNKVYSPESCCFISKALNLFLTESGLSRGAFMIGVYIDISSGKFKSSCSNQFSGKVEHLGYFDDESSAHIAWKKRKHELACQLADLQTDERVAEALRSRYL